MMRAGVSLCMIVRDEERFLDEALHSVAGVVDEICIVDTGSTDRTIEIAHAHRAHVVRSEWHDDFARARNAALALATRRWIFVLDADERLASGSRAALAAIGATRPAGRGKWIACRNLTDTHPGSGAMTNALVRIFPNDPHLRYRNAIHEFVSRDGSDRGLAADPTSIEIVHHGYLSDVSAERNKAERNLRMSRTAAAHAPHDPFAHYNYGMALLLGDDRSGAIAALRTVRSLTRQTPRGYCLHALVVLAELTADDDDIAAALAFVHEALQLVPNYSNAHFVLGKLLVRTNDLFAARDAFGRAIAAGAHDGEQFVVDNEIAIWKAHSEIGATLMLEERYREALAWFELAASARPAAQPLLLNRAKCHEALGDNVAAEALFGAAFRADCNETSAIAWINFLLRRDRLLPAIDAIESALPHVSSSCRPVLLAAAAAAHSRAGATERAQLTIERAVSCGDAAASRALVHAAASIPAMSDVARLLIQRSSLRANGLSITYFNER